MEENGLKLEAAVELFRAKLRFERIFTPVARESGLTPMSAVLLCLICRKEDTSVKSIIRELDVNQGNVSTMCKRLEAQGFIKRRRSEEDERSVALEITEKGVQALSAMERNMSALSKRLTGITPAETDAACRAAGAIIALLEKIEKELSKGDNDA